MKLGAWVAAQRQCKRMGTLRDDRLARLQKLVDEGKFSWTYMADTADERWDQIFKYLLEFNEIHGHCNVPKKCIIKAPDGTDIKLGNWLNDQRKMHKKNHLKPDRGI